MDELVFDNTDILRFCRARKFQEAKIKTMIQGFAEWRQTEQVDFVANEWVFEDRMLCKQLYPHAAHKTDKVGRPVQIERPGPAELERCFSEIGDPNLIRNCIW